MNSKKVERKTRRECEIGEWTKVNDSSTPGDIGCGQFDATNVSKRSFPLSSEQRQKKNISKHLQRQVDCIVHSDEATMRVRMWND